MIDLYRIKTHAQALGIQVAQSQNGNVGGWFYRFVDPAPAMDWKGPYYDPKEAHAAAVRKLLNLAIAGSEALQDAQVSETTQQVAEEKDVPPRWWPASLDTHL